jgi:hypothetical protein
MRKVRKVCKVRKVRAVNASRREILVFPIPMPRKKYGCFAGRSLAAASIRKT